MESQHRAWVNHGKARYYQAHLVQDLFGDWTLRKVWGGRGSRLGGMSLSGVASYEAGLEELDKLSKRRSQRGYEPSPIHRWREKHLIN